MLAAFVAGAVALFAPCCIVVMFPAYLAAAVRHNQWRLVPLTLVFAVGVATVLVPVTLGVSVLTSGLLRYHSLVYGAGAVLLLVLAAIAATGRSWSLPFLRGAPDLARTDSGGVYALGVFSGAASACCAPVLAGVLTLSAVAPGLMTAAGIGLAYVFGMVFPLVVITLVWDRVRPEGFTPGSRPVTWRVGPGTFTTTVAALAAAGVFGVMAVVLAVVAFRGASLTSTIQARFGAWIHGVLTPGVDRLSSIPDLLVGLILITIAVGAVVVSGRRRRPTEPVEAETRSCHDH